MSLLLWKRVVATTLFVFVLFACGFQKAAELQCEEAVSHLVECCPGFRSSELRCIDESSGCSVTEPALDGNESDCLKAKSCEQLIAGGYCARAQAARGATFDSQSTSEERRRLPGQEAVCP